MAVTVFPIKLWYPLDHEVVFSNVSKPFGDGFRQSVNKNLAWGPRADGEGNVITYKGINKFTLNARNLAHVNSVSPTANANLLWNFYKARLGGFDAFYFYNPAENDVIDLTGTDPIGRYLCIFSEDTLKREMFRLKLFNVGISIEEVRA
jgi:hypothetical protein